MLFFAVVACSVNNEEWSTEEDLVSNSSVLEEEQDVVEEEIEQEENTQEELWEEEGFSCDAGRDFWQDCLEIPLSASLPCTEELYHELEMVQMLTCEEFIGAQENLPLCTSMGINCPEDYQGCAAEPLDAVDLISIFTWTDTATLSDIYDVSARNTSLRFIFAEHGDIRGAFSSVYAPITDSAVENIDAGIFTHDWWVRDLVRSFSARYYVNLRASILSQPITQSWGRYYELTEDCTASGLRVAAHGIAVHLIVDLPHTLVDIASTTQEKEDFEAFGLALVEATPIIVDNLRDDFGIESENFFSGFFLGNWIDAVAGDDATTTFAFQTIRNKAWNNGMWLQDWRSGAAEFEIYTSWRTADGILATWDIVQ